MGQVIRLCALAVWAFMTVWFLLALLRKDNSLADVAWGLGFILVALLSLFRGPDLAPRKVFLTALVLVWGARLAVHIATRNRRRGEDFRYAEWRAKWGKNFVLRSYLQVFLLQGLFLMVISYPVIAVNSLPQKKLGWPDLAGLLLWLLGFLWEAAADWELVRFKRDPANRGTIMTAGLWRYCRHPNYFGEAVMWWAIFFLAVASGMGWASAASPLLLTILLRFVSGVPMLEKKYRGRTDFAEYARRTNAFLPWFPRKPEARPADQ